MGKRALVALGVVVASVAAVGGAGGTVASVEPTFEVAVEGGYGAGTYEPGDVVHVWSAASTVDEVVRPWSGDDDLLAAPDEWHTSFVMPARDVRLVANVERAPIGLTVEQHRGATSRNKTVRYHLPASMRGVVVMSHGTGGSSRFIEGDEAFPLALALVDAGYGVIATEAEEVVAGDLNGDGRIRWRTNLSAANPDLANLDALLGDLRRRGRIPAGTPTFALGMSAGGSWSHLLGTVADSAVGPTFSNLRFNAVIAYCADASATLSAVRTLTPSAWYLCGAEDNDQVSNAQAFANEAALQGRGIPTDLFVHQPSPIYPERFARIAGISPATSVAMVAELDAAGFVGPDGFLTASGDAIALTVLADRARFPVTSAQTGVLNAVRAQLKVVRAEHSMFADATARTIGFFDAHVAPPSAPFGSWAALVSRVTRDLTAGPATGGALASWATALEAGDRTRGDLAIDLRRGPDGVGNVDPVARLYAAYLGRTPDAGGLRFWVDRRRSGAWTLVRTADHFASSSEFLRRYGALTNRQYATRLYTDVLRRPADAGGVAFWTAQLDSGRRSRGSVMIGFSESNEFQRQQADRTDAVVLSVFLLGRSPTEAELGEWLDRRSAGVPVEVLADELLRSRAYADRLDG